MFKARPSHFKSQKKHLLELLEIAKIKTVLDIACGTGMASRFLAERGCEVTGVDIDAQNIQEATQLAKKEGLAIDFYCMDVLALEDIQTKYDLVYDWGLLDMWGVEKSDKQRYFKLVHNRLNPGGIFAFFCFNIKSFGLIGSGNRIRQSANGKPIYFTPLEELKGLLKDQFEILEAKNIVAEQLDVPCLGNWIVVKKK